MKPNLPAHTIDIWDIDISECKDHLFLLIPLLTKDEIIKSETYRFDKDKVRYLLTRGYLRKILSHYTFLNPISIRFEYGTYLKPRLHSAHQSTIKFNLSHSNQYIRIAISKESEIGVDIEVIGNSHHIELGNELFAESELHFLRQAANVQQAALFYRLWTQKEALLKGMGVGFYGNPKTISFDLNESQHYVQVMNEVWQVRWLDCPAGYQSAIASNKDIQCIQYLNVFNVAWESAAIPGSFELN